MCIKYTLMSVCVYLPLYLIISLYFLTLTIYVSILILYHICMCILLYSYSYTCTYTGECRVFNRVGLPPGSHPEQRVVLDHVCMNYIFFIDVLHTYILILYTYAYITLLCSYYYTRIHMCRYVFVGAAIGVYFLGCFLAIESKNSREWVSGGGRRVIIMTNF